VITTLSSRSDLISGGDTLLEIRAAEGVKPESVRVTLNGKDVTAQVPVVDSAARVLRGLVTGLTTKPLAADRNSVGSENSLVVSNADDLTQRTEAKLVNYPITGPILSGPHLSPYECRLTENYLEPLASGDSDCSAKPTVAWYYRSTAGVFKFLANPLDPRPGDVATTTTNAGVKVPYIVRVEKGTINRGVYLLAVLDNPAKDPPSVWKPSPAWNKKLVIYFDGGGNAHYNQGVLNFQATALDVALSRGFAFVQSTELYNDQHANPHLQGETLMMLKEHVIKTFGEVPKWTVGTGGSGGAIQQYLIPQVFPGLLDGIQPSRSGLESMNSEIQDCKLLEKRFASYEWLTNPEKVRAFEGFNAGVCFGWSYYNSFQADLSSNCDFKDQINAAKVFNRTTNPSGVRCDIYQTNVNLLGKTPGTQEALRLFDNVGVQYGLAGLNNSTITVDAFLELNEQIGGMDGDGKWQPARSVAPTNAVRLAYAGGLRNSFSGPGLANIPIITQRANAYNANSSTDLHEAMPDLIARERLRIANGRSDNQIIWTQGASVVPLNLEAASLDLMNTWLDNMAVDPAPPSTDKVVRNKPKGATDACWNSQGKRIDEVASLEPTTACNTLYPRYSTPRMTAGAPLANDVIKCQLKPVNMADYKVPFTALQTQRLNELFKGGVCDWSQPGVGQMKPVGTYLRLPLTLQ